MAEFCRQCAPDVDPLYPLDELAGLCAQGELARVICEGCGWTFVDETGTCVIHSSHAIIEILKGASRVARGVLVLAGAKKNSWPLPPPALSHRILDRTWRIFVSVGGELVLHPPKRPDLPLTWPLDALRAALKEGG